MSLRHRLLLLYFIVVLLTLVTVGVAVLELQHSQSVLKQVDYWNGLVIRVQTLRTAFERDALLRLVSGEVPPPPEDADFESVLLAARDSYLDIDLVRWAINNVYGKYSVWKELADSVSPQTASADEREEIRAKTGEVRQSLNYLTQLLEEELAAVRYEADRQARRTIALLGVVLSLIVLHVLTVGWLLRRWLLMPIARLNRQLDALARDEPPNEPLLEAPEELANLANAMDRARRSLRTMRQQLIDAERLTTLGQFTAQLAHNLRNPLASIRAMSQLAARQDAGDGAVKERMQEIIASVDRLNRWIAGLMEAARGEPSEVAAMDVRPVLQRAKEAVESETQTKEVQLEVEMPDQPVICLHEPVTLEHTLVAMLINAIEASPPGERVLLRLDALQRGQEPSMGSVCCISVTDRGSGLPDEDPSVIFDFSFSTKQQGMGLGLALARVGLQRQGGVVCARNNADSGATVWVELPVQEQRSDAL